MRGRDFGSKPRKIGNFFRGMMAYLARWVATLVRQAATVSASSFGSIQRQQKQNPRKPPRRPSRERWSLRWRRGRRKRGDNHAPYTPTQGRRTPRKDQHHRPPRPEKAGTAAGTPGGQEQPDSQARPGGHQERLMTSERSRGPGGDQRPTSGAYDVPLHPDQPGRCPAGAVIPVRERELLMYSMWFPQRYPTH